jgi:hypothetical protein
MTMDEPTSDPYRTLAETSPLSWSEMSFNKKLAYVKSVKTEQQHRLLGKLLEEVQAEYKKKIDENNRVIKKLLEELSIDA